MGTAVDSLWKRPGKASPSPVGDAKLGQLPHGGWQQRWGGQARSVGQKPGFADRVFALPRLTVPGTAHLRR